MFEKKEEKLFEYAFGDLDARDTQIFEAGLLEDEIGTEEVKFLQSIKGDLASFRDIPEMQYSKERLRDAILGQGLKPSRPGLPWLNWVLAPGALACTVALAYVLMNGTSRKNPTFVGPNMAADTSKGTGIKLPKQDLKNAETMVATNKGSSETFPDIVDKHWAWEDSRGNSHSGTKAQFDKGVVSYSAKKSITHTKSTASLMVTTVGGHSTTQKFDGVASATPAGSADSGFVGPESPVYSLAEPAKSTAVLDATLILIDKDQDSGVGTSVATEVNDTKNVVIGG